MHKCVLTKQKLLLSDLSHQNSLTAKILGIEAAVQKKMDWYLGMVGGGHGGGECDVTYPKAQLALRPW